MVISAIWCGGTRSAMAPIARMPRGRKGAAAQGAEQRLDHAGDQRQPADRLLLDDLDQPLGPKAVDHHDRAAAQEGRERVVGRDHVEQRRPGDEAVLGRQAQVAGEHQGTRDHRRGG